MSTPAYSSTAESLASSISPTPAVAPQATGDPAAAAEARPEATPPITDLPAHWTLFEIVAWIMFRDDRIVRDASPETPRRAGTYRALVSLPGGEPFMAEVQGEGGYSLRRLTLEQAKCRNEAQPKSRPSAIAAQSDLLAKLRSDAIRARGTSHGDASPKAMDAADWRGLILREDARGILVAEAQHKTGRFWSDVTVPREDILRLWPPEHEGVLLDRAGGATTIAAETRLEKWLTAEMRANPDNPPGKARIKAKAESAGHQVSIRGFARAYMNAVKIANATAWSKAGRKSKQRIETPV